MTCGSTREMLIAVVTRAIVISVGLSMLMLTMMLLMLTGIVAPPFIQSSYNTTHVNSLVYP